MKKTKESRLWLINKIGGVYITGTTKARAKANLKNLLSYREDPVVRSLLRLPRCSRLKR